MSDKPKCRGSKSLGTACGKCSKCKMSDKPILCPACDSDMAEKLEHNPHLYHHYCKCGFRTSGYTSKEESEAAARNQPLREKQEAYEQELKTIKNLCEQFFGDLDENMTADDYMEEIWSTFRRLNI